MKTHILFIIVSKVILLFILLQPNESYSQTIQQRIDSGETPKQIFDCGMPLDSIIGKTYEGGLIFYMDTVIGNGLVCAPADQSTGAQWGCYGTSITGTSTALYAGNTNTNAIVAGCSSAGIAAKLCDDLVLNSFSDWYLPSRSELLLMISNLSSLGLGSFSGLYWSSTQNSSTHAYTNHSSVVSQKYSNFKVRAIKCFCSANTCPCQVGSLPTHDLVQWEIFNNDMSPDFNTLKNTEDIPSQSISLDSLNVKDLLSTLDYFSSRIRGYLIPPTSGIYSFYFACDDKGQFWLSTDTTSANAVLKSQLDSIHTDWTQNISSQTLVAGQKYFFEILHYDSVYTNMIKLGWKIPGASIPNTITSTNMAGYHNGIEVSSLKFVNDSMLVYPNWKITPQYHITPWNAAYKTVIWKSSNNSIATVSIDGEVTTVSPGMCQIIVMSALNTTLSDTLTLTVSDYYGPFFVKLNATISGDGHSWDNAIQLTKLLDRLNQDLITQKINVYIAEGTYKPTASCDRNKTFLLNNMRIVGGFDSTISGSDTTNRDFINHETILSGEIGVPGETMDNSYHVVITQGDVTIDGLTISDGRANCRMYGDGNFYNFNENQGGGLFIKSFKTNLFNCKITNNSAFNSGGGIFAGYFDPSYYWSNNLDNKTMTIKNCIIRENVIQQNVPIGGGMFYIVVNGYGPAFYFQHGIINLGNCTVYGNSTPNLQPVCRFSSTTANINNCSFFNNAGTSDVGLWGATALVMNNSTVKGNLLLFTNPNAIIKNSTILGGAAQISGGIINVSLDNTIWTGVTLAGLQSINSDTLNSFQAKYSIIGNSLIGDSYENLISSNVPNYTTWLDTLAFNGGPTPTIKLKTVPNNPAIGTGNPLYLDSLDQRGILRAESVSIGAYQWTNPMPENQIDSVDWEIFENITAYDFDTLKNTESIPDQVVKLTSINTPDHLTTLDHFASRIRGYIIPPYDGDYSFYFACDNVGQFWLSSDTSSANAQLKSNILSAQTDWTNNISTQTFVAGRKYFFEILHYDTVYTDQIKLGWKIPGDTIPVIIQTPYIVSSGDNVPLSTFSLLDHEILAYPTWNITPRYHLTPWNAANKNIIWQSSNTAIATISALGVIHTVTPGICQIIGIVAADSTLTDTLNLTVTDYYGPYFVKEDATVNGDGHSWENAIGLAKLLERLNRGPLTQSVTIYAAEGIYKPTTTIDRNKTFTVNNIRLVGGFAATSLGTDTTLRNIQTYETILSGEIGVQAESIDNSYHVVVTQGTNIIDGLTIRDGRASASTYGITPHIENDDHGGGVYIASQNNYFKNCTFTNNSSWSIGGAIYSRGFNYYTPVNITLQNCTISNNKIQQVAITTGGMFTLYVNANGGGIAAYYYPTLIHINDCLFHNNTAVGNGASLYLLGSSLATIERSCFYNDENVNMIYLKDGGSINMNNSTLKGTIQTFYNSAATIRNSTVHGSFIGSTCAVKNTCQLTNRYIFDNTIITDFDTDTIYTYNRDAFADSSYSAKYSILGNTRLGIDKYQIISNNIPIYTTWLDTLAYNGGPTPTMKLQNVPNNPAKGHGNSLYLGTLDQRGAIRSDSVSIGAYQWVRPTNISIMPQQITLCQGDSINFSVTVLPDLVSDSSFTKTSSNSSIAQVTNSKIYAIAPGNVDIIVRSMDGGLADTCNVTVMAPVGTGLITGETSVCQGQTSVTYTATGISNATSYLWTLPGGATGTSYSNSIVVNFDSTAVSGNISVNGQNICGEGAATLLPITVTPLVAPAGGITGPGNVCIGQNSVIYFVPAIANATSYIWTLPGGASGSSDSSSILIDFGLNAVSGGITVKGTNSCGDGAASIKVITVNPVYAFTENHSICNGETYTWQGMDYTSAGVYKANYSSVSGCDSIYTLNLTVNPVYSFTENHSICNGETYTWQGTDYTSAGIFTANYSTTKGCDSIYTLNLIVNPVYAFTENHSICNGETYTWQGMDYTSAGVYTANYSSVSGCDSIYTLNLTVNPVYSFTENHSICNGETYTWQGTDYTSAGVYTANYSSLASCDSIYTLNLTVNPVYAFAENHSICNGETYTWQGMEYTTAGTYTANYSSVSGCDSIYTLNLTVNPVYAFTENHSICNGETYTWQGTDYTSAGTFTANYSSISGCDSMYTLNLNINIIDITVTLSGITLTANTIADAYQWIDCGNGFALISGEASQSFTASFNGSYAVIITEGMCSDTSDCFAITTVGTTVFEGHKEINVYPNPVSSLLHIEIPGNTRNTDIEITNALGQVVFRNSMVDKLDVNTVNFSPGVYLIRFSDGKTFEIRKVIKE